MVSPTGKFAASESVGAAPDSSVAPVIGAGVVFLLLTVAPTIVADGLKQLSDAASAAVAPSPVAGTSEVSARVLIDAVRAVCKFNVVAAVSTPIWNVPAAGGVAVV